MADQSAPPSAPPAPEHRADWGKRLLFGAVGLVVVVLVSLAASAIVPRWWAQKIGAQVNGSLFAGVGLGLLYGIVFTILPLLVLWWTFRRRRPVKVWLAGAVLAVVVALPNLMTLAIVLGNGNGAHAGQRTLDVDAPFFRGFCALGAVLGVVLFGVWRYQLLTRSRAKRRTRSLEQELAEARAQEHKADP